MKKMSANEKENFIKNTEKAIQLASSGKYTDTEAIVKVASDINADPLMIDCMCNAYNKAKSVFIMQKRASDTRGDNFSIVDPKDVLAGIYRPSSVEKVAHVVMPDVAMDIDLKPATTLQKKASYEDTAVLEQDKTPMTRQEATKITRKYITTMQKLANHCRKEVVENRNDFKTSIDIVKSTCKKMPPKKLQKTANLIANNFGDFGIASMSHVASNLRLKMTPLQKTASRHMILPSTEPFLSMKNMQNAVEGMNAHQSNAEFLEKEASDAEVVLDAIVWGKPLQKEAALSAGILNNFLANAAAGEFVQNSSENAAKDADLRKINAINSGDISEVMDDEYINNLRLVEAKTRFFDMVNSDKDFVPYNMTDLTKAWNNNARMHNNIMRTRPDLAKELMLRELEGAGRSDLFDLKTIADISKDKTTTDETEETKDAK